MIRGQNKTSSVAIMPDVSIDLNPFTTKPGSARVLRNWVPERGRLARKAFSPDFTVKPDAAGGDVWHLQNFRYTRASAPNNKLLILRSDGKLYERQSSYEHEIWPSTAISVTSANAGTAAQSGAGTAWTNTGNTASSDDAYATATLAAGASSQSLDLTNFGFALTASDAINGIAVEIENNISSTAAPFYTIQLRFTGATVGTAKTSVVAGNPTDHTLTFGSSTDLWDFGPPATQINDSTFGVSIIAGEDSGSAGATFNIDQVTIKIYHGATVTVLSKKPFVEQLSNRFFFSDGVSQKVWDGRSVQNWGLARTTTAPTVSAVAAGSLTAATGLKAAITWVVLDEAGNRVHESSRTDLSGFQVLAAENLRVDISALSPPSRATHWSAYVSELNGSEVLRRAATTAVATTTVDVSALPASTLARAPIRNDPPPPSTVGTVAKNRHWLRDDANPNRFYFSALGEVLGLANGAADESFPGYGSNSISDLTNSDFIPDQEIRCIIEHSNIVFVFGSNNGYAYIGELNLLDNRAPRSINRQFVFSENCAGPNAAASTPYGLCWMNSGRKIWLWVGGQDLVDIGEPIQAMLDTIPSDTLFDIHFTWYSGNGRQWLLVNCKCSAPDNASGSSEQWRTLIYDFSRPTRRALGGEYPGSWYEWVDITGTTAGVYRDDEGLPFLMIGDTNGEVLQADVVAHPCHLEYTAELGKTYLSSSPENNPGTTWRSGLLMPSGDVWTTGHYLQILSGAQEGPGAPSAGSLTDPTVVSWVDIENPDSPGTSISLTLDTATTAGDKRAWLVPQASGNTNVGGALAKQFLFQMSYAAGNDATGESDGRTTARINSIYKMGFTYTTQKEDAG